ncbi:MAG: ADOP family duplicated permease [Gemmatimonadota bacterium]
MSRGLGGRRPEEAEREIAEEIEAHLAHRVDALMEEGLDPDAARRRARAEFGDVQRWHRECAEIERRERIGSALRRARSRVAQDLAFAVRQLRRSPGFAAVALATLALGIGATTTIVGVVRAVVLQPLPFSEPDRLVWLDETTPAGAGFSVAEGNYVDWRASASTLSDVGALRSQIGTLSGDEPRALRVGRSSASLLPTLGVAPRLGRGFTEDEDRASAPAAVAVLGDALWRDAFGADADVIGRDIVLDGVAHRVVGVLPEQTSFLDQPDVLVPLGADASAPRDDHDLAVVARLAPDASATAADRELDGVARRIAEIHPVVEGWGVRARPISDVLIGESLARAGSVLLVAAILLLLIACVNVSNLLLARNSVRAGELSVRAALGASRGRIGAQLFTEGLLLAAAGGLLGLGLARALLPLVQSLGAGQVPRLDQATLDPWTLAACAGAVLLSAAVFGLAPLLDLRRPQASTLRETPGSGGTARALRLRSVLVTGQVALSVFLLLGTGLLLRSFLRLSAVDPGFEVEQRVAVRVDMPDRLYGPEQRHVLLDQILERVRGVPGVTAAGASAVQVFSGFNLANFAARADRMPTEATGFLPIGWRVVTPGWFEAMGIDVRNGRAFGPGDDWEDGTPTLINAALAEQLWPGEDAVGGTLVWGDPEGSRLRIVGIVDDVRDVQLTEAAQPMVFRSHRQIPWAAMTVVAHVDGPLPAVGAAVRQAVREVAPGLPVPPVRPLSVDVTQALAAPRFNAVLVGTFGVVGLLLALIGVYGVTSWAVRRREREIGIRLALGAEPSEMRGLVLGSSLKLALVGTAIGVLAALGGARAVATLLYETAPSDPATWVLVPTLLLAATALASWIPARRATRVDPKVALAAE